MKINYIETAKKIRKKLKVYILQHNLKSLVIGVSGGIDSASVAALSYPVCKELEIDLIGRSIPIETNKNDEIQRAEHIGKTLCTDFETLDMTDRFKLLYDDSPMDTKDKVDRGNAKARLRMMVLYGLARKHGGIVLSTDNKTEFELAFWTLHGDVGDLGIIQDMWKTYVYDMTEVLYKEDTSIPLEAREYLKECIECDATDGLGISNTDLDQLLPDWQERHSTSREGYKEVDDILISYNMRKRNPNFPSTVITRDPVISRSENTMGKKSSPINFKFNDIVVFS